MPVRRDTARLAGRLLPQPGGFEGHFPVSEGLLSHRPAVLDRDEQGEAVKVLRGDLAGRPDSADLDHRDHLVAGVDQLYRINRVPRQRLAVSPRLRDWKPGSGQVLNHLIDSIDGKDRGPAIPRVNSQPLAQTEHSIS
jgi:hypothetical protein